MNTKNEATESLKGQTVAPAAPDTGTDAELLALALEAESLGADPAQSALADAAAAAVADAAAQWAALVTQLGGAASPILAPNWNIQRQEWEALGEAWAPILAEHFPDVSALGPWPGAILTTALIVAPRLGKPLRAPAPKPNAAADTAEGQGNG